MIAELKIAKARLEVEELNKEQLEKYISKLEQSISITKTSLSELKGTEYKLFYEIVVKGINPTKAIDRVSARVDKDPSTLWKYNYPKIKPIILFIMSDDSPVPKDIQ